ncbi:MAG: SHOCT domain-containing protein [Spirochaetales bacterium]|nr:SHOCT domain-containing protein [Spirochaetales bacterium]
MGLFGCFSSGGVRGGWGMNSNFLSTGGIFMMIGFLLIAGLIVYLIVKNYRGAENTVNDPLGILKARLAKGEITVEEYNSLKKEILG